MPLDEAKELCLKRKHWDCVGQYRSVVVNSDAELMFCSWDAGDCEEDWCGSIFDTTGRPVLQVALQRPKMYRMQGCRSPRLRVTGLHTLKLVSRAANGNILPSFGDPRVTLNLLFVEWEFSRP